jgi:prolyl oligopeptidase
VFAEAYGAYQYALSPNFQPRLLAFLDEGGIYVVAGVRGGGEYGREWHKAGQKATKPNTWRDFIDVSEALIDSRVTSSRHLVIHGVSAGGITVGRALTERPDLFAAAVAEVGWMNPIRYVAEQNFADIDEWGPIVDADSFRIMYEMDSYHAIREGTRYPAVLITTGFNDPRVATFHSGKFAARLQAEIAGDAPVLLRVDFDSGHGLGSTRAQRDALSADIYAFALWRAGVKGFETSTTRAAAPMQSPTQSIDRSASSAEKN